jgi:hypothetical protein
MYFIATFIYFWGDGVGDFVFAMLFEVAGSISDVVIKIFHFKTHYGPRVDLDPD